LPHQIRTDISECASGSISGSCYTSKRGGRTLETEPPSSPAWDLQLCNDTGQNWHLSFSLEKLRVCVSNLL